MVLYAHTRGWTTTAGSFHSLAVLSTTFRLWYRWSLAAVWWDDAWAVVALLANMASVVSIVLERPTPGSNYPHFRAFIGQWIDFCAFPIIMWASRLSILTAIVRVCQPQAVLKRIAICVGLAFGVMWICSIVQRVETCVHLPCRLTIAIAIVQTATDTLADLLLTMLPALFLYNVKLCQKRKTLILVTFSTTMVINVVTIVHATVLFKPVTSETVILTHVKSALSTVVCNLFVIVIFVCRVLRGGGHSLESEGSSAAKSQDDVELTTVELSQAGSSWDEVTSKGASFSVSSCDATRSSTWSFRSPSPVAAERSDAILGTARGGTGEDVIVQEER